MSNRTFAAITLGVAILLMVASRVVANDYFLSAAYTVLQFVILATAWNVLGGYAGYVNFGSAAFFAVGAYSSVFLYKAAHPPLIVSIAAGTVVAGLLGMAVGYFTLRLRG
ncbi:MAG TPA: branched-chain amino acid ABC transporter permease, partial [Casimicrobiaceae bacterium]|nr:branched-chain amino acid ABC transporter permease [Casimicrobiaceae bacterium]